MMENVTGSIAEQENKPVEKPAASLGKMLREARERLGMTVEDVASQIKFAPRQIEALEAEDFQRLPEAAFLRGFVRSYAKVLHLDAETLLAALPQNKPAQAELVPDSVGEPFPNVHSALRQNLVWMSAALLLMMIVAGFAYWHFTTPPEHTQIAQVESPISLPADMQITTPAQPVPEVPVIEPVEPKMQALAQSPVQAANTAPRLAQRNQAITSDTQSDVLPPSIPLRLEFSEDSWAEIKDKDGKILSSRVHPAGSELRLKRLNGQAPFSVLIGHASSVRLYYRDKEVDLAPHIRRSTNVASLTLE
ncbi:MAG: helix-turn-helix domain-containing protein [Nitrosomonadales bacterium]|nr:helix-turn-helix domain-containing protein [Nitrosomonadales bacterium]